MSVSGEQLFKDYNIVGLKDIPGEIEGAAFRVVTSPGKPTCLTIWVYLENIQRPEIYHLGDIEPDDIDTVLGVVGSPSEIHDEWFHDYMTDLIGCGWFVIQEHVQ